MASSSKFIDRDVFVDKQLQLIQLEYEAEIEKTKDYQKNLKLIDLVRQGVCIHKLRCNSIRTGLFRRTLVTFSSSQVDSPLPAHKITAGDIVSINEGNDQETISSGVVYSLNSSSITVAFDKESKDTPSSVANLNQEINNYCIIKISNDVTYRRLKKALINLRNYPIGGRAQCLIDILFGKKSPSQPNTVESIGFINNQLDDSQRDAVTFALSQKEICIVHGPPGTGKTTTLTEIILQLIKQNLKVLVCAPSNVAIDNLVEKLANFKTRSMIRLGHPARASSDLQKFTLDAAIARSDDNYIIEDIRKEIDGIKSSRDRSKRSQIHDLMSDLKQRERGIIKRVLASSQIVLSTLTSASGEGPLKHVINNPDHQFDVLIIDEASQALESACWIPMTFVTKCVLAGDHFQLPPTIISEEAAKDGLEYTLMERLLDNLNHDSVVRMLTVQYRMHQDIMAWSSSSFYSNKLIAHESVRHQSMSEISSNLSDCPTLLLIDTAGCDMFELDLEDEESKGNESEADIASAYVLSLIESNVKPESIGVITPYNLQVELIRLRLHDKYPNLEIRSVDGFQGREKEVIILCLVRSNADKQTGFLAEFRRINVAVTRAKKHLVVICDSETVSTEPHIASLIEYLQDKGEVKSAHEYLPQIEKFADIERPQHLRFKDLKKIANEKSAKEISKNFQSKIKKNQHSKDSTNKPEMSAKSRQDRKPTEVDRQNNLIIKQIRDKLTGFLKSAKNEYSFPSSLSSFERKIVHDIAEELKLLHISQGEGEQRYIMIKKFNSSRTASPQKESTEPKNSINETGGQIESKEEEEDQIDEKIEAQKKPKKKKSKSKKTKQSQSNEICQPGPVNSTKPEKKKKDPSIVLTKSHDLNRKLETCDDIDEMLEFVKKIDGVCFAVKCKVKTSTLGMLCQFCKKRFCLSHSLPEIHGCGDAVRAYARANVRKTGKLYPGLGIPDRKPDQITRGHLEKKLNKKLEEMNAKRKTQSKQD